MIYALDTNILSYILNGNNELIIKLNSVAQKYTVVIPMMVYYEIRRGLISNKAENKLKAFDKLCKKQHVIDITTTDLDKAAVIYAKRKSDGKMIDDADLLIAAQCVTNGYKLITNNVKHFNEIDGLLYENWVTR